MDQTRLENLAAIKAIDNQMAKILEVAEKLDRETIVIFQSDNGGTSSYLDGKRSARGCNFPYKGFKSTLFEGGTLSPSFIYSTKQRFPNREVSSMLHITDWFPTILWFARINLPDNLDGVNQQIHIRTVLHIVYSASPSFLHFQNVENRVKKLVITKKLVILTKKSGNSRISRQTKYCLLYTSPSPRDGLLSRMPSSA